MASVAAAVLRRVGTSRFGSHWAERGLHETVSEDRVVVVELGAGFGRLYGLFAALGLS